MALWIGLCVSCNRDNPAFDVTMSSDSTSAGDGTHGPSTGDASSSGFSASTGDASGSSASGGTTLGDDGDATGLSGGDDGSTTGASGTTGSPPDFVELEPSVAECVSDDEDPDECESFAGMGHLLVDASNNHRAVLRFEPDPALSGATIVDVRLRLVVTDHPQANSDSTGAVWAMESFTRNDLFNSPPATVGGAPLAGALGAVSQGELIEWVLPTSSVTAGSPTFLGVLPESTDAVSYWNLDGATPPRLWIDLQ